MSVRTMRLRWVDLVSLRRWRRLVSFINLALVCLGPALAALTYVTLGPLDAGSGSTLLRLVLFSDFIYVMLIVALVLQRVLRIIAQRRQKSSGSRLHLRLTGVFSIMALLPTITVAAFALLSINMGFEAWFSDRVQRVIGASLSAADSYQQDQRRALAEDADALAEALESYRRARGVVDLQNFRVFLSDEQVKIQRGLREAFVINGMGDLILRGNRSYLFDYEPPSAQDFTAALTEILLIEDLPNNELRALIYLSGFADYYLLVSRDIDGNLYGLLDETRETAKLYQQLESERGYELFQFGLIYLAFAVLLIVSSILLALLFAERLSRPIGRLAGAAQAVGEGNLDTQVIEEEGDDELSSLSRYFNQMTRQLKQQRDRLLENTQQIERRGRVFDSVLSSVTSGVFGLDPKGMITFANPSAERLLGKNKTDNASQLSLAVPEFAPLLERLQNSRSDNLQEEVKILRLGRLESFLVRLAPRRREDGRLEGYVVAFDDVTDLVSAQRSAAWGDVARRIAHEIKNPLTPIQLSAERIQRKFAPQLGAESGQLEQMTDVIIRQTNDLRRIVDEFSKFARMPELVKKSENLNEVLAAAVTLQESGQPGVTFELKMPDEEIWAEIDATMLSQALTNVLKNAGEAIEAGWRSGLGTDRQGEIRVEMQAAQSGFTIAISDNGIGLPQDRSKLFEPYVTTRENGTGLGLAIVKKIIQEHGGTLSLLDAAPFSNGSHQGAKVLIDLTHSDQTLMDSEQKEPN